MEERIGMAAGIALPYQGCRPRPMGEVGVPLATFCPHPVSRLPKPDAQSLEPDLESIIFPARRKGAGRSGGGSGG
jgi:hypothetical protein